MEQAQIQNSTNQADRKDYEPPTVTVIAPVTTIVRGEDSTLDENDL